MSFLPALLLQAPAAAPAGAANPMVFFIQIGVIFLIFYFIVMRPQRKQQKLLEQAILSLSKGDEVTTTGGLIRSLHCPTASPSGPVNRRSSWSADVSCA
jgi:hypothetical protein